MYLTATSCGGVFFSWTAPRELVRRLITTYLSTNIALHCRLNWQNVSISQFYIIFLYIYILQLEKVLLNQATRPQRERPTSEREIQTDVGTGSRGGEEDECGGNRFDTASWFIIIWLEHSQNSFSVDEKKKKKRWRTRSWLDFPRSHVSVREIMCKLFC